MTTSHTPGPWKLGNKYKSDIYSSENKLIARVGMSPNDADAKLIAAAPELLAALQNLLAFNSELVRRKAFDAIAKATS